MDTQGSGIKKRVRGKTYTAKSVSFKRLKNKKHHHTPNYADQRGDFRLGPVSNVSSRIHFFLYICLFWDNIGEEF